MSEAKHTPEGFDAETVSGISFYSATRRQKMRYLYPDCGHHWAGWIMFKHPDGNWVSLRKATDSDIEELASAVSFAHHNPPKLKRAKAEGRAK